MPNTTYYKNLLAGNAYGKRSTIPDTLYVALSTTTIGDNGANFTEPSGGAYARVEVQNNTTYFSEPTNGVVTNLLQLVFPESTEDWGTIVGYGLYDEATGGNLLCYGDPDVERRVETGTEYYFKVGKLELHVED